MSSISFSDVFGLHPNKHMDHVENYIPAVQVIASLASIVVSPLVGILRIIINLGFLLLGDRTDAHEMKFAKMQIIRGGLEFLCLGPILAIVDVGLTIYRACSLESAESTHN